MIYLADIQQDTTIYDNSVVNINAGDDSILELLKDGVNINNSRILIQVNVQQISESIARGIIPEGANYKLRLYASEPSGVPVNFNLYGHPISGSWNAGLNEYYDSNLYDLNTNWKYRTTTDVWTTSSYASGSTGSYDANTGGGTWYISEVATQSFNYGSIDINMDITNIMTQWLSGSYENNGILIKRSDESEAIDYYSKLQYFSSDTNTIYSPKLEISWDDSEYVTGSIAILSADNITIKPTNLSNIYNKDTKTKLRLAPRPKYPARTFSTQSSYRTPYILPTSSYYSVVDSVTYESIIPFDDIYTKVSADISGSYFDLWMTNFPENRWMDLKVKVVDSNGEQYYELGTFKVSK